MANTKSILIIGGSGFIGTQLALKLREGYKVFATYHKSPYAIRGVTFFPFNLENKNWVKRILYTSQPDVLIYVAGNNTMTWSEKNPRQAEGIHTGGPAIIGNSADLIQPRFIFLSNSYVFDGTKGNYHETDTVLPTTILGRMKLGGENVVRSKYLNYIILRSSALFGRSNGKTLSFFDQLRMSLDRNQRFEASKGELHSFAPVQGLCELVLRLVDSGVRNRILHYGGLTKVSFFQFANEFARQFKYDTRLIVPKKTTQKESEKAEEEYVFDFSLNCTQATEILKIKPLLLEEGFDLIKKQLITRP